MLFPRELNVGLGCVGLELIDEFHSGCVLFLCGVGWPSVTCDFLFLILFFLKKVTCEFSNTLFCFSLLKMIYLGHPQ